MIIAECCTNWLNLDMAKDMILEAKEAGAGLAKFQLFDAEDDKGKPHYQFVKDHELNFEQAKELFDYGESIGMEVFFSIFGAKYVDWCEKIGVKRYKIACGMRDRAIITKIYISDKPTIISSEGDYGEVMTYLGTNPIGWDWLYCVPNYPAKLDWMPEFAEEVRYIGFSDHTIGLDAAKIAIARDAQIIEKHFNPFHIEAPDSPWSMDSFELAELVRWEQVCKEVL